MKRVDRGDAILGWRPAAGQEIARRPSWVLDQKVGEGGFGEVWLARHDKTGDRRVFKFCFDEERLRALQREITVFRLLKEELGDRDDIARILEWNFDGAPYFIESEYTAGGSLIDWAAAHSVGVLHRDMKPGNVLIHTDARGATQARVCDFGMGVLTEQERLESAGITVLGMTRVMAHTELATTSGTMLYTAPELTEGKAATIQADVYAVGLMLYQLVVGNLSRAMGAGWERGVEDELLREDIASAVDVNPKRRPASALERAGAGLGGRNPEGGQQSEGRYLAHSLQSSCKSGYRTATTTLAGATRCKRSETQQKVWQRDVGTPGSRLRAWRVGPTQVRGSRSSI